MIEADGIWEQRIAELWKAIDGFEPDEFHARLDALVAGLPPGSAIGLFERGAAQDSTGHPAVRAFLALALVDLGREREAVAVSLTALSHYLPRYNRSLARYAGALSTGPKGE